MKKIFLIYLFFALSLFSSDCYQSLDYSEKHKVQTTVQHQIFDENKSSSSYVYVRFLKKANKKYNIFWLGDASTRKDDIDMNSIKAPFLVEYTDKDDSYLIKDLRLLSLDNEIRESFFDMVDIFQFASKNGKYKFKNKNGFVEVEQEFIKGKYFINRLGVYENGILNKNINYNYSSINISKTKKNACSIWENINLSEDIKFKFKLMNLKILDKRTLRVKNSNKAKLPKNHWFFKLGTDIKKWGFKKRANPMNFVDALNMFDKKEKEMLLLINNSEMFEKWVLDNMNYLKHLSSLLENRTLNDEVSLKLFAKLGFLNTIDTSQILGEVVMNDNILERDRFRGVMALKDTSAPLDEQLLSELLSYGLSSENGNDFIKNATGMLSGAFAKERIKRVPAQADSIMDSIVDAVYSQKNKTVALAAAGNLQEVATENVVNAVDDVLLSTKDENNKEKSANALLKIKKSNLSIDNFHTLIKNEKDTDAKISLIGASVVSKGFKKNENYKTFLENTISKKTNNVRIRVVSINTLRKSGFGDKKKQKLFFRKAMLGETNSDIIKALKKAYRN